MICGVFTRIAFKGFPLMIVGCGSFLIHTASSQTPAPAVTPIAGQKSAVEAIPFQHVAAADLAARKVSYSFTATSNDWLDTKVTVTPGDRLSFTATGSAMLSDGRTASPAGAARGWRDMVRTFPDNAADVGALIGRIGSEDATVPFSIGATKELAVAATGDLYLRINTSSDLTTTGTYAVTMKIAKQATAAPATAPPDLTKILSPKMFDAVPRRVQDQVGNPGDMVNFSLIGTQDQVEKAFTDSGWVAVDKNDQQAVMHGLLATLQHQAYTGVPVSTLYLFGRPQDLSFERAAPIAVAAVRHHLRVWKTTQVLAGEPLWVGSATHDEGFERDQRNGGVTHHVDPNIDDERNFLEKSFADSGVISGAAYVTPANPFQSAKTATGGAIQSDGRIVVMQLRPSQ
jgi:hypothetical protein